MQSLKNYYRKSWILGNLLMEKSGKVFTDSVEPGRYCLSKSVLIGASAEPGAQRPDLGQEALNNFILDIKLFHIMNLSFRRYVFSYYMQDAL